MERQAVFARSNNYALYYGCGGEEYLSRFDVAIVEPAGQSRDSLKRMQSSGTLVLAYLSVVEIPDWAQEIKILKSEDFLGSEGEPYKDSRYGNYLADPRSGRWAGLLLHRAGKLVIQEGYDGLFLDTIGDVESARCGAGCGDSLILAAAGIVRCIREMFPEIILIQNCGLERLCLFTAAYLDGICWENPPLFARRHRPWAEATAGRLIKLKDKYRLKILLLLEEESQGSAAGESGWEKEIRGAAGEIFKSDDYLIYRAPLGYVGGIDLSTLKRCEKA